MLTGALIVESLREEARLEDVDLKIRKLYRLRPSAPTPQEPEVWSVIEFEAAEEDAGQLAEAFSQALLEEGGWYADFRSPAETFVVFAGKCFRYPRGDRAGRAEAAAYGRAVGVTESQLDWPV